MKKKISISILILLIFGFSAYLIWGKEQEKQPNTAIAQNRDLIQTVDETGEIRSPKRVSLSFSASGRLSQKEVEIGETVKPGEILAELNHTSILKEKQKVLSELETARTELEKVLAGASEETIKVKESQVNQVQENYNSSLEELEQTKERIEEDINQIEQRIENLSGDEEGEKTSHEEAVEEAELNLNNVKKEHKQNIINIKESSLIKMDAKLSVANIALDKINKILEEDDDIQKVFSAKSSSMERRVEISYEESLQAREAAISALETAKDNKTKENILEALSKNIEYINKVSETLDYCYEALEKTVTSSDFSISELNAYKTEIDNMITRVNASTDELESVEDSFKDVYLNYDIALSSAKNKLDKAQTKLEEALRDAKDSLETTRLTREEKISSLESKIKNAKESLKVSKRKKEEVESGATQEEIDVARTKVRQAENSVDIVEDKIDDYRIASPVKGKVVSFDPEVGEQIQPGQSVVSVFEQGDYKVEVNISETDIDKINKGDIANITLDAFGDEEKFKGKVSFIEPDQTVIQDVIYYEVELRFLEPEKDKINRMKSGMTANVSIITKKKEDVLTLPSQAIIEKENQQGELQKYVKIEQEDKIKQKPVKVGTKGDDGMVEIIDGIKQGEEVITYMKDDE